MEYLLRDRGDCYWYNSSAESLNPYCYGIPSQSADLFVAEGWAKGVLILIVMEYLLREILRL